MFYKVLNPSLNTANNGTLKDCPQNAKASIDSRPEVFTEKDFIVGTFFLILWNIFRTSFLQSNSEYIFLNFMHIWHSYNGSSNRRSYELLLPCLLIILMPWLY